MINFAYIKFCQNVCNEYLNISKRNSWKYAFSCSTFNCQDVSNCGEKTSEFDVLSLKLFSARHGRLRRLSLVVPNGILLMYDQQLHRFCQSLTAQRIFTKTTLLPKVSQYQRYCTLYNKTKVSKRIEHISINKLTNTPITNNLARAGEQWAFYFKYFKKLDCPVLSHLPLYKMTAVS